ncbi:PLP-dependent aminotransferase family protein [Agromyces archimandritae]|uniref:PLP-dependent aminotransferase family protein n=1 Tax=Agromyces archimandritae TaxID=2781962 RepID=A0A975IN52_9MICO|nr:PLP-dependent aminotransferase family protein [Agromyces archimandritae]QTX04190.1 PLP-dependent aminotransferase family protein [Agromyces archimandritae]
MIELPLPPLDRDAGAPLAEQLAAGIRSAILGGGLRAGDALPSTRTLAGGLGVSRGVAVAAYERLAGEGYLQTRPGAAARIAELVPPTTAPAGRVPDAGAPGHPPAGTTRIDLRPGLPSTAALDDAAWRAAWRHAAAQPLPQTVPPPAGEPRLRAALAEHLRHARGVICDPGDLIVTAGTAEALALLADALAARGRPPRIAVEDPGYPAARRTLRRRGAHLVPIPVAGGGFDVDRLDALDPPPEAVLVTPSHQYPLGGRLGVAERLRAVAWAARTGGLVIEDDYDSEFRHAGPPLPALASLDEGGRTVLIGSLSKVLSPSLRVGYLLVRDPGLRAEILEVRADDSAPVAGIVQLALARFAETGALQRHIARSRRAYAHRRRLVERALAGHRLGALDGGLHAVVGLAGPGAEHDAIDALARAGIDVAALSDYAAGGETGPHGIVLGYGAPGDAALARALAEIASVLRRVDAPAHP